MDRDLLLFALGLLLSIHLAIVTNLVTPRVANRLSSRNRQRARRRAAVLKRELTRVAYYRNDPAALTQHFIEVILTTTVIGAVTAVVTGSLYAIGQLMSADVADFATYDERLVQILYLFGQVVGLMGSLVITILAMNAVRLLRRVRNFDDYRRDVERFLNVAGAAKS